MIRADGLTRRYGDTLAVADVTFHVAAGEMLALVGDSGSGKTTTLKMINRLVEPDAGTVVVEGKDTAAVDPHALRRSIGYVFQGVGLFPHMTVARERRGAAAAPGLGARAPRAPRLPSSWPSSSSSRPSPSAFPPPSPAASSSGSGVARALASSPRVMLLDEPFGALDPLTRDRLQRSFDALRRQLSLTAVFVTHDMAEALLLADRIGVMRGGRLVQVGEPAELARSPADEGVARLLDTPRRQARLVAERLEGRP